MYDNPDAEPKPHAITSDQLFCDVIR